MPTKVILDTDIGDDVDDALALALICALPQLELLGVTTVFGNTTARARQAQTLLQIAGEKFHDVPVAAGCPGTMASRKVTLPVADPDNIPGQASASWPDAKLPAIDRRRGVEFLLETLMNGDGSVIPITIGALTNLAAALVLEPKVAKKIPRIVAMAAEFHRPMAEWNIKCDPEAAAIVFASGIPMHVIPFNIGILATFNGDETARLASSPRPVAKYLTTAIEAWRKAWTNPNAQPHLFDPMAVACIVNPDLFEWKTGKIKVELAGESTYGYTTFTPDTKDAATPGPHKVAWNCSRETCVNWYLHQILAG